MGTHYQFDCPTCSHEAMVSGGRDCGMVAVTMTMVCRDCRDLVDVLIGAHDREGPTGDPDYDKNLDICPECGGRNLIPWSDKHQCPRCGSTMEKDDIVIVMWD